MRSYEEDLKRVSMPVASPDRSVRLTLGLTGDVDLSLADGALRSHSAAEMERQLAAVLRSAVAGSWKPKDDHPKAFVDGGNP